ncbi:MAG: hypothetical protein GEU71_16495 [Actinobacteria bacterium]|nr:hypothetical protein [Actinomycetota bacterium]
MARWRTDEDPEDCYEQFFHATQGLVPDNGGRQNWNLDGLHDDLRDLSESLTVVVDGSEAASRELGEWFWRFVSTLTERGDRDQPVEVVLTSTGDLAKNRICLRCGRHVRANADSYETFERMHWVCFHFEYEHGDDRDPDQACGDPRCPSGGAE